MTYQRKETEIENFGMKLRDLHFFAVGLLRPLLMTTTN